MDENRRARGVGLAAAMGAGLLTCALGRSVVVQWSGRADQEVATGLSLIATTAAAVTGAWLTLTLVRAVLLLAPGSSTEALAGVRGVRPGPARALPRRVAAGLLVVASWGAVPGAALGAADPLPAAAPTDRGGGVGVAGARAAGPGAEGGDVPEDTAGRSAPDLADALPEPGWARTVVSAGAETAADLAPGAPGGGSHVDHVVVRRGDTLWGITARHLGDAASDRAVAEQWPRWYAANRDVIGEDPDLILPGQQLVPPPECGR